MWHRIERYQGKSSGRKQEFSVRGIADHPARLQRFFVLEIQRDSEGRGDGPARCKSDDFLFTASSLRYCRKPSLDSGTKLVPGLEVGTRQFTAHPHPCYFLKEAQIC